MCDAVVRGGCEKDSVCLGEVGANSVLTAVQLATNSAGQERLCFRLADTDALEVDSDDEDEVAAAASATLGWVSLAAGDGTELVRLETAAAGAASGDQGEEGPVQEARDAQATRLEELRDGEEGDDDDGGGSTQPDEQKKSGHKKNLYIVVYR